MKSSLLALIATLFAFTPSSYGLGQTHALCTTSDGQYIVAVMDTRAGENQDGDLMGMVSNLDGTQVASYTVKKYQGIQSTSFGRAHYYDTATQGAAFLIQGPSTNFRNYTLHAQIQGAGSVMVLNDQDLQCTTFE